MDKYILKAFMIKNGDYTQQKLADAMSMSLSRLNAKINEHDGAEFNKNEILFIKARYNLTPDEVDAIFFSQGVS